MVGTTSMVRSRIALSVSVSMIAGARPNRWPRLNTPSVGRGNPTSLRSPIENRRATSAIASAIPGGMWYMAVAMKSDGSHRAGCAA